MHRAWLLVLLLAPNASAATGYLPLSPGDAIDATDSDQDVDLDIETRLGQRVLAIHTATPGLVAVRIEAANHTLRTHFIQTLGPDAATQAVLDELQARLSAQDQAIATMQSQIRNTTLILQTATQALAEQRGQLASIHDQFNASQTQITDLQQNVTAAIIAARQAGDVVRSIRVPTIDLEPIQEDLASSQHQAEDVKTSITGLYVLAAITLAATLLARGDHNRIRSFVERLRQQRGQSTTHDRTDHQASQRLAAELFPGTGDVAGGGTAPALPPQPPSTDAPDATPTQIESPPSPEPPQPEAPAPPEPSTEAPPPSEPTSSDPPPVQEIPDEPPDAPEEAIQVHDERLRQALRIEGGLPQDHPSQ